MNETLHRYCNYYTGYVIWEAAATP